MGWPASIVQKPGHVREWATALKFDQIIACACGCFGPGSNGSKVTVQHSQRQSL